MRVLILGVNGFIGKYLARYLHEQQVTVIGAGRTPQVDQSIASFVEYFTCDYSVESIGEICVGCDAIVLLAATRLNFNHNSYKSDIEIAVNTFEAAFQNGIKKVVVASSRSVYADEPLPWKEDVCPVPPNLYGASKVAIERLGEFYTARRGMSVVSLRLAQVMGWGEREGFVLNTFLEAAFRKELLTVYGTGKGIRQFVYIKDVLSAIKKALEKPYLNGIFNIGMEETISIYDLACKINEVFENSGNLKFKEYPNEDLSVSWMDVQKAKTVMDWKAEYTIEKALTDLKRTRETE